MEQIM